MGRNEMVEAEFIFHQQEMVPAPLGPYYKQALLVSTDLSQSLGSRSHAPHLHERVFLGGFD